VLRLATTEAFWGEMKKGTTPNSSHGVLFRLIEKKMSNVRIGPTCIIDVCNVKIWSAVRFLVSRGSAGSEPHITIVSGNAKHKAWDREI
jgi:hypothetical protein